MNYDYNFVGKPIERTCKLCGHHHTSIPNLKGFDDRGLLYFQCANGCDNTITIKIQNALLESLILTREQHCARGFQTKADILYLEFLNIVIEFAMDMNRRAS